MEQNTIQVIKLSASDGMVLTDTERTVFGKTFYLGVTDSVGNYTEIPEEEAERLQQEQRGKRLDEIDRITADGEEA